MGSIWNWSRTPSANGNSDNGINLIEGQSPGSVNDAGRAIMARHAELLVDIGGSLAATGSNSLTLTTASAFTDLFDGLRLAFRVANANTGAATLNVNGLGGKAVLSMSGAPLTGGELSPLGVYEARYRASASAGAGAWILTRENTPSLASEAAAGLIELATAEEGATGTDASRAITPAVLAAVLGPTITRLLQADPAGRIVMDGSPTPPPGWISANGQTVSRATYPALFARWGTYFGPGNGSTTFKVIDLREVVPAGVAGMGGTGNRALLDSFSNWNVLGAIFGAQTHQLTEAQLASHRHEANTYGAGAHNHRIITRQTDSNASPGGSIVSRQTAVGYGEAYTDNVGDHAHYVETNYKGGSQAHNNVQPTIAVPFIIRAY